MTVPGVAWIGLILLLIPIIQQFVQMQWPESSYAITALVVGVLGVLAKWLEMYFKPTAAPPPSATARSVGETGASTPAPQAPKKLRRFLVD